MKNVNRLMLLLSLSTSNFAFAAEGSISVMLEAFSGRENPVVNINLAEDDELTKNLGSLLDDVNSGSLSPASTKKSDKALGYKGVVIFDPTGNLIASDTSIQLSKDLVVVTKGDTATTFDNPYPNLEKQAFKYVHKAGKIDKHVLDALNQQIE